VEDINDLCSTVSRKILAKKKSLVSLQKIASIVEDVESVDRDLDQMKVAVFYLILAYRIRF